MLYLIEMFAYLFSIKFLYFFTISSLVPYFNLFVSIFIQSYVNSPPLQMNDQDLHVDNSHKHLHVGVISSDNGQWSKLMLYGIIKNKI
jgi:hypothetical protein